MRIVSFGNGRGLMLQVAVSCTAAECKCGLDVHRGISGSPSPRQNVSCHSELSRWSRFIELTLQVHGTMAKILSFFVVVVSHDRGFQYKGSRCSKRD